MLIKSILENVARSVKHTSLEFTLLSERMAHFEKLLVFLDSQIHSLNAQSKAVMGSIMKVSLENKAAMSRLADVMVNMTQEFVKAQTGLKSSKEEIFDRIFGPQVKSLATQEIRDMANHMPSEEYLMEEMVFRLNELTVKDVELPRKPVLTADDLPHTAAPPKGKNYKPHAKLMEKSRLPTILEDYEEGEVKAIVSSRIENRVPAVNKPIEMLKLSSKDDDIERVREAANQNYMGQPERRSVNKRPVKRPDKLKTRRTEENPPANMEAVATTSRKSSRSGTKMGTRATTAAMSPKRKIEETTATASPKRAKPSTSPIPGPSKPPTSPKAKHPPSAPKSPSKSPPGSPPKTTPKKKLPTARKSTTPKDRKLPKKPPVPTPNQSPNRPIDDDLEQSLVEISSDEEAKEEEVVEVTKDSTTVVDWEARDIKRELIEESEVKAVDPPTSPANVED